MESYKTRLSWFFTCNLNFRAKNNSHNFEIVMWTFGAKKGSLIFLIIFKTKIHLSVKIFLFQNCSFAPDRKWHFLNYFGKIWNWQSGNFSSIWYWPMTTLTFAVEVKTTLNWLNAMINSKIDLVNVFHERE